MKYLKVLSAVSLSRVLRKTYYVQRSTLCKQVQSEVQDIYVPTSYGHIAGKVWGPENGKKILAIHGWQDNCGSFDTLIPLLPKHFQIVAIDLPGHGLSTHKPLGSVYDFIEILTDIKTVSSYLKWDNFSLLGHSMGGGISLAYACCFPDEIKAVATVDGVDTDVVKPFNYGPRTAYMVNKVITLNKKLHNPAPTYSYEAAKERLFEGQKSFMTMLGISHLMKRAVKPSGGDQNSFVFTRDIRLQAMNFQLNSPEIWIEYLKNIQCNLLRIKAKDGLKIYRTHINDFLVNHYKEREESFQVVEVEGLHHVHLENPEKIAPYLSQFFPY